MAVNWGSLSPREAKENVPEENVSKDMISKRTHAQNSGFCREG